MLVLCKQKIKVKRWLLASGVAFILFWITGCASAGEANNVQTVYDISIEKNEESRSMQIMSGDFSEVKEDNEERNYASHREFPYESMECVDETIFSILEEEYKKIDFSGEFNEGNKEQYDEYIQEYKKLVNNEITFLDPESGAEFHLEEFEEMKVYDGEVYDPSIFEYFFFDVDGDDRPELGIKKYTTYIFKYDDASKQMQLWHRLDSLWDRVHGTLLFRNDWSGMQHSFYKLNQNAEVVFGVYFMEEGTWSNGRETYMLTVPFYKDEKKQIEVTQEMQKQAYYSESEKLYYFKVTKEQYEKVTKPYFDACTEAENELEKVSYSYEELMEQVDYKKMS